MLHMHFRRWGRACRNWWQQLLPPCGHEACVYLLSPWRRLLRRSQGVRLAGIRYCGTECLEQALAELLERTRPVSHRLPLAAHRIPLGLLLLSRQQLTADQLRSALEAQRAAGRGKIGDWLQRLGFSTEEQVTAALARQWSCPVLRTTPGKLIADRFPQIPVLLLESFKMIPVESVKATKTLLMAFAGQIDYTVLYAIEQMVGYRTEPCLVKASILEESLHALAQDRAASDVVFEHVKNARERARIVGSYSEKIGAKEIRLAHCGEHVWVRLECLRRETINLVLMAASARQIFDLPARVTHPLASQEQAHLKCPNSSPY